MVSHGVDDGTEFQIRSMFRRLPFFVWNPLLAELYTNRNWTRPVVIGSPLLYVEDLAITHMSIDSLEKVQKWAAFAPHHIVPTLGRLQLEKFLSALHSTDFPVGSPIYLHGNEYEDTVCLNLVTEHGFIPATVWKQSDSIWNINFVRDLIAEFKIYNTIICEGATTAFWYAAFVGIDARVLTTTDSQRIEKDNSILFNTEYRSHIFWPSEAFNLQKIRESADKELGRDFKLEPDDLARELGFNSPLKQFVASLISSAARFRRVLRSVLHR